MQHIRQIPRVAIVKIENDDIAEALRKALSLLGPMNFDGPIAIKPNLCDLIPASMGATTDVRAVEALIRIIREKTNSKISIVESDHWIASADEEFERLGYKELALKLGVELVNLSKDKKATIRINGYHFDVFKCPKTLLESRLISVSKMKTHYQYRFTGILKNQFGLIPEKYKAKYHPFMAEVLADLNNTFRPFLSVIEGLFSMEVSGPAEGKPIKTNVIICGTDPVAVDAVAAEIAGINPLKIGYLRYAAKKGVGELDNIEVVGDNVQFSFKFVPFLAFVFSSFSLKFLRLGRKIDAFASKISDLLEEAYVAAFTLRHGFHTTLTYGSITREGIFKFAKALIRRTFYRIKKRLSV